MMCAKMECRLIFQSRLGALVHRAERCATARVSALNVWRPPIARVWTVNVKAGPAFQANVK